jgi:hypothetical protein
MVKKYSQIKKTDHKRQYNRKKVKITLKLSKNCDEKKSESKINSFPENRMPE